eukprot:142092-Chlamydomonas_euryale.AAC.6
MDPEALSHVPDSITPSLTRCSPGGESRSGLLVQPQQSPAAVRGVRRTNEHCVESRHGSVRAPHAG